jgi:hypothetical protein
VPSSKSVNRTARQEKNATEPAHSCPSAPLPQCGSSVRSESSCSEVADHIDHIHPATGIRNEAVDSGLIRNVARLYAYVKENDACDQPCQVCAPQIHDDE